MAAGDDWQVWARSQGRQMPAPGGPAAEPRGQEERAAVVSEPDTREPVREEKTLIEPTWTPRSVEQRAAVPPPPALAGPRLGRVPAETAVPTWTPRSQQERAAAGRPAQDGRVPAARVDGGQSDAPPEWVPRGQAERAAATPDEAA